LPIENLKLNGIAVDRVYENPEAARYFLMFADWKKISSKEIFSDLDKNTARHTQVYVDFPFCKRFCDFCAFYGVVPKNEAQVAAYTKYLNKEIQMLSRIYFSRGFKADALEFGGGTPTYFSLQHLKDVTECILGEFPFLEGHEFNFEASPETIVGEEGIKKLEYLKSRGANRMSIGVQSFVDAILKNSNRPHDLQDALEAIRNAKEAGFERINVDLLLGLDRQTIEDFLTSVLKTIEFGIDIIELYTLRYFDTKEFIPLKRKLNDNERFLSAEDLLVARIAADIILRQAGYQSSNGRTYQLRPLKEVFYADYYDGNFKGKNTLGIGRKSNSNMYPWQYANYRNFDSYYEAIGGEKLPIAAGTRFTEKARAAKLLTGMFQLPSPIDYRSFRLTNKAELMEPFDELVAKFESLGLIENKSSGYEKTFSGFLFIEEMLKQIYDAAVTPFSSFVPFLGKPQVSQ